MTVKELIAELYEVPALAEVYVVSKGLQSQLPVIAVRQVGTQIVEIETK